MIKNYNLKPYTVYYRDFRNIRLVNCFYANDAFEAKTLAMNLRIPCDWGLEIGLLSEVYRNVRTSKIAQVDLGLFSHERTLDQLGNCCVVGEAR